MGLSAEGIGKILTPYPHIIGYSVEDKLQPTAEYFRSLGVDVAVLLCEAPQICGYSLDTNLKPVTEFFLENGYSMEEVGTMISRHRPLYTKSLANWVMTQQLAFLGKLFFCQAKANIVYSGISGYSTLEVLESFPNSPDNEEKQVAPPPASLSPSLLHLKKLKSISRVSEIGPTGELQPQVLYLIELGMDLDQIKCTTRRFPNFIYYSLEGNIKPLVEFLVDTGVPKSDIPSILNRNPRLCGLHLSENIIPTMAFLEGLGVEKKQWAKLICCFPSFLTCNRQKVKSTVDFLYEMGLSAESIGKILTRFPQIVGCSVEDKLWPISGYFCPLGVDVAVLLRRAPQIFGLNIKANLKPVGRVDTQWRKLGP